MKMKLIIAGVARFAGQSKKTGNNYDFCRANVLEEIVTNKLIQQAEGYEAKDMDCEPQILIQLRGVGFPIQCDCELQIGRDNKVRIVSAEPVKARSTPTAA